MQRETLLDFFRDLAEHSEPFLIYDDGFRSEVRSYGETGRAARAFAARLALAGLAHGDKAVIWSENRPEWIVAFWGSVLAGVTVVPMDYRVSADMVARVRDKVGGKTGADRRRSRLSRRRCRAGVAAHRNQLDRAPASRWRAQPRATNSPRSSSPPARRPNPRAC